MSNSVVDDRPSVVPRTIMVTGASRGIGRAIALSLAEQGHSLILTARSVDGGAKFSGTSVNDPLTGIDLTGSVADVAQACQALGSSHPMTSARTARMNGSRSRALMGNSTIGMIL
jgi:NAD(P)-dependent dehydrogenase (short-subunit alcohol dehydrogenase family)